jgi:hypothetical protein
MAPRKPLTEEGKNQARANLEKARVARLENAQKRKELRELYQDSDSSESDLDQEEIVIRTAKKVNPKTGKLAPEVTKSDYELLRDQMNELKKIIEKRRRPKTVVVSQEDLEKKGRIRKKEAETRAPSPELPQEPVKEAPKEPAQEPIQEAPKEAPKELVKEPPKELPPVPKEPEPVRQSIEEIRTSVLLKKSSSNTSLSKMSHEDRVKLLLSKTKNLILK